MELASFLVAPFLACRSRLLSFDIRENFHAVDSRTATAKRSRTSMAPRSKDLADFQFLIFNNLIK